MVLIIQVMRMYTDLYTCSVATRCKIFATIVWIQKDEIVHTIYLDLQQTRNMPQKLCFLSCFGV